MNEIAIFDYGAGNLYSLKCALERNGAKKVSIIKSFKNINRYDGLILPGVGNFDPAIKSIEPYRNNLNNLIEKDFPILGICLGMEMLFDDSEEGKLEGLKILNGKVIMLPRKKVKIPHMGWNNIEISDKKCKILHGLKDGCWLYFVHSYHIVPKDKKVIVANSTYGGNIPVVVEKNNLFGTQFHPEKSGINGAKIIKNFLRVCDGKN
ncbi:MAG TPA: imidazole glycerol phosphate synthase subunit HisH [Nitrososphaeraceae archaeon]|nr:imidazole glycerol phosphate synthase subunit HisH [Nitrososphaeraceae archaeon]